ncbi:MAG: hypothetical protein ACXWL5_04835 [Candidatus Chromulinivorax sp.]
MKKILYGLIFSFVSHASDVSEILNQFSPNDRLGFQKYVRDGKEKELKDFLKEWMRLSDCEARLCVQSVRREVFGTPAFTQTSTINVRQQNYRCDVDSDDDEMELVFMGNNQDLRKKYKIKPRKN